MILTNLNLHVALMPPRKFWFSPMYGFRKDVCEDFQDDGCFGYWNPRNSDSPYCPNASHQVLA